MGYRGIGVLGYRVSGVRYLGIRCRVSGIWVSGSTVYAWKTERLDWRRVGLTGTDFSFLLIPIVVKNRGFPINEEGTVSA